MFRTLMITQYSFKSTRASNAHTPFKINKSQWVSVYFAIVQKQHLQTSKNHAKAR